MTIESNSDARWSTTAWKPSTRQVNALLHWRRPDSSSFEERQPEHATCTATGGKDFVDMGAPFADDAIRRCAGGSVEIDALARDYLGTTLHSPALSPSARAGPP